MTEDPSCKTDRSGSVGNLPKLEETGQGGLDAAAQVSPAASAGINAGFLAPQAPTIPDATLPDPDQVATCYRES